MMFKHCRALGVCLVCFILAACSRNTGSDYLDNYLDRLENVLNVEPDVSKISSARTSLRHHHWGFTGESKDGLSAGAQTLGGKTVSSRTISILDFLSLYGCDLQMVVAEGNTSLGKFAPPSQVLLRHLRFLHHAPACIQQLDSVKDGELISQLQAEQRTKQNNLPKLIWRVILHEDEARQFWRKPASLGHYPDNVSIDPELAIRRLGHLAGQWQQGKYLEGINELERLLGDLRAGDGGALLSALSLLQNKLNVANQMLESYLYSDTCAQGRPAIDQTIVRNVVEKYFVGEVQVWAAELNRRVYSLIDVYQALEAKFGSIETDSYRSWRTQRDEFFESSLQTTAGHVKLIQKALNHCANE